MKIDGEIMIMQHGITGIWEAGHYLVKSVTIDGCDSTVNSYRYSKTLVELDFSTLNSSTTQCLNNAYSFNGLLLKLAI